MLLNILSSDTLLTLIVSVAVSALTGVIAFLLLYFTNLIKIEHRLTKIEEKVENQQKTLDFVEEKIINEVIRNGNNSNSNNDASN